MAVAFQLRCEWLDDVLEKAARIMLLECIEQKAWEREGRMGFWLPMPARTGIVSIEPKPTKGTLIESA